MWNNFDDPFTQYRRNRIVQPRSRQQQNMGMIQNTNDWDDDDPQGQFWNALNPSTGALDKAEEAADQAGGMVFNRENFRKYMEAIDKNESAPRPARDALSGHLAKQPTRKEHSMGKGGAFLAAAAGGLTAFDQGAGRGFEVGQQMLDRPYNQARQDWMDRTGPLEYSANLEEKGTAARSAALMRSMQAGVQFENMERQKQAALDQAKLRRAQIENIESQISNRENGYVGSPFPDPKTGKMMILKKNGTNPLLTVPLNVDSIEWQKFQQQKKQDADQLKISGRNAATAERNARTNEASLQVDKDRLAETQNQNSKIDPTDQLTASRAALQRLSAYPGFKDFIDENGDIKPFEEPTTNVLGRTKTPMNEDLYEMFLREYTRLVTEISRGRSGRQTRVPRP